MHARENENSEARTVETGLQTAGRGALKTTFRRRAREPVPTTSRARTGFQKHTFNASRVDAAATKVPAVARTCETKEAAGGFA